MRLQSDFEEKLNAWTHGFGALLGIAGLILLISYKEHRLELD